MSLTNVKLAEHKRHLLPPYIRTHLLEEEQNWKEAIFANLEKYIQEGKPDQIDYWFNALDVYTSFETFTLTAAELEKIGYILYNFIITSKHLTLVSTAAQLFVSIIEPKHIKLNLKFDWKPIYKILYDSMLSHSKTRYTKYPSKFIETLIIFIRYARNYWEESATEKMLNEWKMILDPHYQTFTLGISQLTLFLPVNHNKHNIWLTMFRNLWTLYRSISYDFQFFELFARLSRQGYEDVPWSDMLPFIFNVAATHMGIPTALLETPLPQAVGINPELYSQFYKDCATLDEILALFAQIVAHLLTGSTRMQTRSLLSRMLYIIAPLCTVNTDSDDSDGEFDAPILFIDELINEYSKRVKYDRDFPEMAKLEPFNSEDHAWFAEQLIRLIVMNQFHENPPLNNIIKFAQICPSIVIPPVIQSIQYSFNYEHLKTTAIQSLLAIAPAVIYSGECFQDFMPLVVRSAEEISFMDTTKSSVVFSLISFIATTVPLTKEHEQFIFTITQRCIEFCEHAIGEDFIPSLGEILTTMSRLISTIPPHMATKIAQMVKNKVEDINGQALSSIVEALDNYAPPIFAEEALKATTLKQYTILKALARQTDQFYLEKMEQLTVTILGGFINTNKKIRDESCAVMKWILKNMLNTYPMLPKKTGYVNSKQIDLKWHVPKEESIEKADNLIKSCLSAAKELIESKNRDEQLQGITICRSIIKGTLAAVSSDDIPHYNDKEGMTTPPLERFHDQRIAQRFLETVDLLVTVISSEKFNRRAISQALKILEYANAPRDHIASEIEGLTTEHNYNADTGHVVLLAPQLEAMTYNVAYWKGLQLYSLRHSLMHVRFPKCTRTVLEHAFKLATHSYEKIRNAATSYISVTTASFHDNFFDLFDKAIDLLEKVGKSESQEIEGIGKKDDIIAGISDIITALPNCYMNRKTFYMIMRAALAICIQLSPDEHLDSARSLRQVIVILLDQTDSGDYLFSPKYLSKSDNIQDDEISDKPFSELRKWFAKEAIKKNSLYPSSRETWNYAAALVCAIIFGQPLVFDAEILTFVLSLIKTDDRAVRECVIGIMPTLIESFIPRIPRPQGVKISEINEENYDDAAFEDRRMPTQASKMPKFLTKEEYLDIETIKKYFPNEDAEERVKMHKVLFDTLEELGDPLEQMITYLVDAQIHKDDNFSKTRVAFWCALCRFLGINFTHKLFDRASVMINSQSLVPQHVVAAEIFAGVLHSVKSRPYSYVKQVSEFVLPFVTRLLSTCDPVYHSLWYLSFFMCFNEMDPRRLFWLYEHILTCVPTDDNLRAARAVSLITDILLDVAFKIKGLTEKICAIATVPLFSNQALSFEQIRESSVRALIQMVSLTFDVDLRGRNQASLDLLSKFVDTTDNEDFINRFVVSSFGVQSLATLSMGEFVLSHFQKWATYITGKDEDKEQLARAGLCAVASSNWLGSISKYPVGPNEGKEVVKRILAEFLKISQHPWQIQCVLILIIESFLASSYFLFDDDEVMPQIVEDVVIVGLGTNHTDVQDAAAQLLTFICHHSMSFSVRICDLIPRFSAMLHDQQIQTRLAGAKALYALINGTTMFDDVPQYVIDCFQILSDAMETDKAVEPTISQSFSDFWSTNESNLMKSAAETLAPFRASLRPSYFC
ncbi:hypothetical protein TVAG_390140 [Trichomonas vaginalis G3]|uniref:Proteasome activator complex subunit 4-like HEAT repeat-like domain-containing protein n=1 Tax=Trichomonas vaginalis (strain ATCC PRA-98 / G3) TaxID=412133 RepID=A2E1B6_TRIV3|nr:proteasome activator complex subunit 4 family [Trichomonas vaginalis G3]EAY13617.1 hypothetical protein TVAG_390140 [Trichomonas vaginalis G3]KAI5490005.1 proteasome activator complex subunit 4 family [Trichomonas vaginalis G3]|eukprot:XP_001325840.1 hypothetical protein [Trichomonas vaginalis G3]